MPQLRGDQLRNLTIKDAQIADDANIAQKKIDNSSGWISDGIMHICTTMTHPIWDGSQNGLLYFYEDSQELIMGTNTSPFFTTLGKRGGKWNVKVTRLDGNMGNDWDGTYSTEFTSSVPMNLNGENSLVYLNGVLHRLGSIYDYTINNNLTNIKFNYGISDSDVVTIVVFIDEDISTYLGDYVTKSELKVPTTGNSGSLLIGVAPIQNVKSNILQGVLEEIKTQLDESIKQYDHITNTFMGSDGLDWNQIRSTEFKASVEFSSDSSNLFVYYNGQLQKFGTSDDYIILDSQTIKMNFDISASDRITLSIMTNLSMSSYITYQTLASSINNYSGATKIGVTKNNGITSSNVQNVLEDLSSDIINITSTFTVSNNKIGFFGQMPEYPLDIRSNEKVNSKNGYQTAGKCISQYFKSNSSIISGDVVGIDITTGYIRKYQKDDVFVGICVESTGFILNGTKDISQDATYCLVGIKGSMHVDQTQILLINREAYTLDNKRIGVMLVDGDIFI